MRLFGAVAMAIGVNETWRALYVASQYGFHSWVSVVEQTKGRTYNVPLFDELFSGTVWLVVGASLFCWETRKKRDERSRKSVRAQHSHPTGPIRRKV
jgi:hypothetical protein